MYFRQAERFNCKLLKKRQQSGAEHRKFTFKDYCCFRSMTFLTFLFLSIFQLYFNLFAGGAIF